MAYSELDIAIQLAVEGHAGQVDRGGSPYILHPLKVMYWTKSDDVQVKAIAIMHDLIEDNKNFTYKRLSDAGISDRVIAGVRALTKLPGQTYDEYKEQVKSSEDAILVKMADLRHNSDIRRLKGVTQKDIDRVTKYHKFYLELQVFAG